LLSMEWYSSNATVFSKITFMFVSVKRNSEISE
jgi:hypothetical protein